MCSGGNLSQFQAQGGKFGCGIAAPAFQHGQKQPGQYSHHADMMLQQSLHWASEVHGTAGAGVSGGIQRTQVVAWLPILLAPKLEGQSCCFIGTCWLRAHAAEESKVLQRLRFIMTQHGLVSKGGSIDRSLVFECSSPFHKFYVAGWS